MSDTRPLPSNDPTRDELLDFLRAEYRDAGFSCGNGGDEAAPTSEDWAVEMAAYYVAAHWHGGQWSNLYAALCASPFSPGAGQADLTGTDADEDAEASYLYAAASAEIERLTYDRD